MDRVAAGKLRSFTQKAFVRVAVPPPLLASLNELGEKLGIGKLA